MSEQPPVSTDRERREGKLTEEQHEAWKDAVNKNISITLSARDLDRLISCLFSSQSSNFRALSAIFNLISQKQDTALSEARIALEDMKKANKLTSEIFLSFAASVLEMSKADDKQ